jgi:hypothetical protein
MNAECETSYGTTWPAFSSLAAYAEHFRDQLIQQGWCVHKGPHQLAVGGRFKNGAPKKTPSIALACHDGGHSWVWDDDAGMMVQRAIVSSEQSRPWRVDSWRFTEGRRFKLLTAAAEVFLTEVFDSDPTIARGMCVAATRKPGDLMP